MWGNLTYSLWTSYLGQEHTALCLDGIDNKGHLPADYCANQSHRYMHSLRGRKGGRSSFTQKGDNDRDHAESGGNININ